MDFLMEVGEKYGLFVALVVFVIWDARNREQRYIGIIETLSDEVRERLTKIEATIRRKPQ